jgi:hypothetical protein
MQSREVEEGFSGGAGSARTALRAGWLKATMTAVIFFLGGRLLFAHLR